MKTYVINLIGGPGVGKTTLAALLFAHLKILGEAVEFSQEYAKTLVWKGEFDKLNDQYRVSFKQYKQLKMMDRHVRFIITDGCILNGIYYGGENKNNYSNVKKTNELILKWFNEFNNLNIIVTRGRFKYETAGRYHTEQEAKAADAGLKKILVENELPFNEFKAGVSNIDELMQLIGTL